MPPQVSQCGICWANIVPHNGPVWPREDVCQRRVGVTRGSGERAYCALMAKSPAPSVDVADEMQDEHALQRPSEAVLAVLRREPGREFKVAELAEITGLPGRQVGTAVANYSRRRSATKGRSEWRHVHRVAHGLYTYDPSHTSLTCAAPDDCEGDQSGSDAGSGAGSGAGWEMVGCDDEVVVLRGPDGALYAARPLSSAWS